MHITKYTIENRKPTTEEATKLLMRLKADDAFYIESKKKAIVWAYDRVGLTFEQIGRNLGHVKSYIHKLYHEEKKRGGRS